MAQEQVENPPAHADTAPQAEIRQESLDTLFVFSVAIAVSMVLPAIALVIVGFDSGIQQLGIFGANTDVGHGNFVFLDPVGGS